RSIALGIQKEIYDATKLTSSSGVSYNKYLAKIASGMNKPAGTTVLHYGNVQDVLNSMSIGKFPGVGAVTEQKMKHLDIYTGQDLYNWSEDELIRQFGRRGAGLYQKARGIGTAEHSIERIRKSVGKETTFNYDIDRKSTRLNSSHVSISYAVFCLTKKSST